MGIEKDQLAAITSLFHGGKPDIGPALLGGPGYSPNQRWLGYALKLEVDPLAGVASCLALYDTMTKVGHQAVGSGYGNEQGAPDPHTSLWAAAHGYILWWAQQHRHSALLLAAIDYWADHLAMCREFMTPAGVRMPCARAIFTLAKGQATTSPRPSWVVDSRLYGMITGMDDAAAIAKYGKVAIGDPAHVALDLMRACYTFFVDIRAKAATAQVRLGVPIRRWTLPDGFDAAMVEDQPMNDRMSWIAVDKAGGILNSGNTLAVNFHEPAFAPDVIGGAGGTVVRGNLPTSAGIPPISHAAVAAMNAPKPPLPATAAKHAGCLPGLLILSIPVVILAMGMAGLAIARVLGWLP
jgi:hypothetical protein